LFVVLRLLGGSQTENEGQPKMYDSEVQLTDKPDMFTMDDEEGGQRAEMPCGHAISMNISFNIFLINTFKTTVAVMYYWFPHIKKLAKTL
jgi:hypothetical protein